MAIQRATKRQGKLLIRIFPDKPVTKKPLETRMGRGKGGVEEWVAVVQPGRVMYEIEGVTEEIAREAFRLAGIKLPAAHALHEAGGTAMKANEIREKTRPRSSRRSRASSRSDLFKARIKNFTNQLDATAKLRGLRRDIARIKTVLTQRESSRLRRQVMTRS